MDVTPQLIEQIDFSEKFRGYDPDQVDDFLERVGATIAELNNAVRDANLRAERAEQAAREAEHVARDAATHAAAPAAAAMSDEEVTTTAARTLMLAQRTADELSAAAAAEAEQARREAQTIRDNAVHEARSEADRLVADARSSAAELIAEARRSAERELATRRDEISGEIAAMTERQSAMLKELGLVESRIESYREHLRQVHGDLTTLLDDPAALQLQSPLTLTSPLGAPTATPFVEATAHEFDAPAAPVEPTAFDSPAFDAPAAFDTPAADVPAAFDTPAFESAPFETGPFETAAFESAPVEPQDDTSAFGTYAPVAEADAADPALAEPDWSTPTPTNWEADPTGAFSAVDASSPSSVVAEEPWAPGSWSAVIGDGDTAAPTTTLWDDRGLQPATGAVPVAEYVPMTGDVAPTMADTFGADSLTTGTHDRFLRDLDEAVNQPVETESDDAMTAFFEGDDAPQPTSRRFRRR